MPNKIGYSLAFIAAAAGLAWVAWPGPATNPAILINRVDVAATVVMLAGLPLVARRLCGPVGGGWLARVMRAGGYAAVFALVLVKADVERAEYATPAGRPWLAGLWTGEIVFLVVLAAYIIGLLAVTARRPPAGPAALAIGSGAGLAVGLAVYALPPLAHPPHVTNVWLAGAYAAARVLVVPFALGAGVAAGLTAARRTPGRGGRLPLADARARQGVAAGLCAGAAAALLVSLLGISTVALLPHEAMRLQWALPSRHAWPGTLYAFEVSVSDSAAGHLLVLVLFPLLGAGLGAWGGLYGADRPRRQPGGGGGGGGGGGWGPAPAPPPPGGARLRGGNVPQPGLWPGVPLPGLPLGSGPPQLPGDDNPVPGRRERVPAGTAQAAVPAAAQAAVPAAAPAAAPGVSRQGAT